MVFPYIPMLLAGAVGALGAKNVGGTKGGMQQISTMSPQQQELMNQLYGPLAESMGMSFDKLKQLLSGDPEAFEAFEAPMMRKWEQEIMPSIAERFGGAGSHGMVSGSGLQQTLAQSGRELSEGMAALRANLQQNAMNQVGNYLNTAMGRQTENIYMQPTAGPFAGAFSGMGQGFGNYMASKYF